MFSFLCILGRYFAFGSALKDYNQRAQYLLIRYPNALQSLSISTQKVNYLSQLYKIVRTNK